MIFGQTIDGRLIKPYQRRGGKLKGLAHVSGEAEVRASTDADRASSKSYH